MFPSIDEIGKRRRRIGLKQSELAKMASVSQSFIAKIESGKIDPAYTKVKTIFEILEHLEAKSKIHEGKVFPNKVISVQKHEPVIKIVKLMKEHGFSQIPVFDRKQVVGSVSEKTILHQIISGKELSKVSNLPAEAIMEDPFPQINEDAPLSLISRLLQTYLAVLVFRKGEVTGIITKADLLRLI